MPLPAFSCSSSHGSRTTSAGLTRNCRIPGLKCTADPPVGDRRIGHDQMFAVVAIELIGDLGEGFALKGQ